MNGLRKFVLVVACFLYFPLLLILPVLISLNVTIANPTYIKSTLVKAKFYQALSDTAIKQATKDSVAGDNSFGVAVIKDVASPEGIQQIIEPTITNFYVWLDKPEGTPNLTIGLKPIQDKFKEVAEAKLQAQLTNLPRCKTAQANSDPTTLTCLPPGVTVQQVMEQAKLQFSQQAGEIGDQQAISLTQDQPQPEQAAEATPAQKPDQIAKVNIDELRRLAMVYHWTKVGLPVVEVLLGICTLAIILLSRPIYKSLKKIGWSLFTAGVLISITGFGTSFAARILIRTPATDDAISKAAQNIAYDISDKILSINTKFMIGYLSGGLLLLIISLIITKTRKSSPKTDKGPAIEKDNMLPADDKNLDDKVAGKSEKPVPQPAEPQKEATEKPPTTKIDIK